MAKDVYCKNCRFFWEPFNDMGRCRRYPPGPQWDNDAQHWWTTWPDTYAYDWCGEFDELGDDENG